MPRKTNDHSAKQRQSVDLKVLAISLLVLAVFGATGFFWHQYSVRKISGALLEQAKTLIQKADESQAAGDLEAAGKSLSQAVESIWQYKKTNPDDVDAVVLLAKTFERAPQSQGNLKRISELYSEAAAKSQGATQQELYVRVSEVLLDAGEFKSALDTIERRVNSKEVSSPIRARVSRVVALALYGRASKDPNLVKDAAIELGQALADAIALNPKDTLLPVNLASVYRNEEMTQLLTVEQKSELQNRNILADVKADEIVDQMVARNNDSADAYLKRYDYFIGKSANKSTASIQAFSDLNRADQLEPDSYDVNMRIGGHYLGQYLASKNDSDTSNDLPPSQLELLEKAEARFRKCIELEPNQLSPILSLGNALAEKGIPDETTEIWTQALQDISDDSDETFSIFLRESLVRHLVNQGKTDEAKGHLDVLSEQVKNNIARMDDPKTLSRLVFSREYLAGLLNYENGEYGKAIADLELLLSDRSKSQQNSDQTLDITYLLGSIYLKLGLPSQAANTFESVLQLNDIEPDDSKKFRERLVEARSEARQFEMARDAFEPIARTEETSSNLLELARLCYKAEAGKPENIQDWSRFENAVRRARELNQSDSETADWKFGLLELQANQSRLVAVEQDVEANKEKITTYKVQVDAQLDELEQQVAADPELVRELILVRHRAGDTDGTERLLTKYDNLTGGDADAVVLRAGLLVNRQEFEEATAVIESGLENVSTEERVKLELAMVSLNLAKRDFNMAIKQLTKIAGEHQDMPNLVIRLADLAIQTPGEIGETPADWETLLAKVEGPEGPYQKFIRAKRKMEKVDAITDVKAQAKLLSEASEISRDIKRIRNEWPPGYVLAGEIQQKLSRVSDQLAALKGNARSSLAQEQLENAKSNFRKAIDLGDRRPYVLLRLAELEPAETGKLLAMLDNSAVASNPDLTNLRTISFLGTNDLESAKKLVLKSTDVRANDPSAWLSRAQVESIANEHEQALVSMETAVKLALKSESPSSMLKRIFFASLASSQFSTESKTRQRWTNHARELMPAILEQTPDQDKNLVRAEMLASLGDRKAEEFFLAAERESPNDTKRLELILKYFSSRNFLENSGALDKAIDIARKLVTLRKGNAIDRRNLARLLTKRGETEDWKQAAELLNSSEVDAMSSSENQRILAVQLLNNRAISNSQRISNLEQAHKISSVGDTAADLLLSGQILREWAGLLAVDDQRDEKLALATDSFTRAFQAPDIRPGQLQLVAEYFIETNQWNSAKEAIGSLRAKLGNNIVQTLPVLALTSSLEAKQGSKSKEDISKMIRDAAAKVEAESTSLPNPVRARLFQEIAEIFKTVGDTKASIDWRQKAVEQDPRHRLILAANLAANGNRDEAINKCIEGFQQTLSHRYVLVLSEILTTGENTSEQMKISDEVFASALEQMPSNVDLLVAIGNVRLAAQGETQKAIDLYEKAFEKKTDNLTLLNNLATAYTEQGTSLPRALELIEMAISKFGKHSGLVDTQAVILMLQGDLERAKSLLKDIVHAKSDSRYWLHLAEVNWRLFEKTKQENHAREANAMFKKSQQLGLENEVLTPNEKRRLEQLRSGLNEKKLSRAFPKMNSTHLLTDTSNLCFQT